MICCTTLVQCLNVTCQNRVGNHPFRRLHACYIKAIDRALAPSEQLAFQQSYSSPDKIKSVDIFLEPDQHGIDHIPTEVFSSFPHLETLHVNSNVKSISSSDFQSASNLTELAVSNGIETIPANIFPANNRLTFLSFEANRISSIDDYAFERLHRLFSLKLQRNQLTIINRHTFVGLSELYVLNLNENQIISIADDAFELPKLQFLQIQQNRLTTLSDRTFRGLPNLIDLSLSENRIETIMQSLHGLLNLKKIDLSFNQIDDIDLNEFAKFPMLIDLRLISSGFTFAATKQNQNYQAGESSQLEYIYLDRNNLSDSSELLALMPFAKLNTLSLENNLYSTFEINGKILKEILPKLKYLSLDGNLIEPSNFTEIAEDMKMNLIFLN